MKFPGEAAERVAHSLLEAGPATARGLAERLGMTPTAARKQLALLVDAGFAEAAPTAPFGRAPRRGRGRPGSVFSLTAEGRSACGTAYDRLAIEALRHLADTGGSEAVRAFARIWAASLVPELDTADVGALAEHLSREGYAASVEPLEAPAVQLCQHHCPVVGAAANFPELCEAEAEAMGAALGVHVTRLATLASGDGVCTTLIPLIETSHASPAIRRKAHA